MQIWAEPEKAALPICNYSQILYQFLTFTQNLKRSPTWFVFLTTYSKGIYRKMCLCIMSDIHHGRYLAQHCFCP